MDVIKTVLRFDESRDMLEAGIPKPWQQQQLSHEIKTAPQLLPDKQSIMDNHDFDDNKHGSSVVYTLRHAHSLANVYNVQVTLAHRLYLDHYHYIPLKALSNY